MDTIPFNAHLAEAIGNANFPADTLQVIHASLTPSGNEFVLLGLPLDLHQKLLSIGKSSIADEAETKVFRVKLKPDLPDMPGTAELAAVIVSHPQAEFIWGKNPQEALQQISLRQQLAIITKYWGGYAETAARLCRLGKNEGGLSAIEAKKLSQAWDNFNRRDSQPPDARIISQAWNNCPPNFFDLDYPIPSLIVMVLQHSQWTEEERKQISQESGRESLKRMVKIYKLVRVEEKLGSDLMQLASLQTINAKKLQEIEAQYGSCHYQLNSTRPLPEMARAMLCYLELRKQPIPPGLTESASLGELAKMLFSCNGGFNLGRSCTQENNMTDPALRYRLKQARGGKRPYWSDDWEKVTEHLDKLNSDMTTNRSLVDVKLQRRRAAPQPGHSNLIGTKRVSNRQLEPV